MIRTAQVVLDLPDLLANAVDMMIERIGTFCFPLRNLRLQLRQFIVDMLLIELVDLVVGSFLDLRNEWLHGSAMFRQPGTHAIGSRAQHGTVGDRRTDRERVRDYDLVSVDCEERIADDIAAMVAVDRDRYGIRVIEMRDLADDADRLSVRDDRIALAQCPGAIENDRGPDLAAMDQRSGAEPHRSDDDHQYQQFSHHRCHVNSRLTIRILHSKFFVLKNALHSPTPVRGTQEEIPMSVEDRVKSIIVEQLGVDADEVNPEASFVEDLGADSLDTVELIMAFEEEFGVEISDDEAEKIKKVKDAVEYIDKRAKAS